MLNSEKEVLEFWKENNLFEKSIEKRKNGEPFVFLDGPPFATGLPHWGHIMVSQVKDSVLRYQTQKGRYVPRRWGWDCHGVPIEKLVEKELGVKDKRQIDQEIGVEKFNDLCRQKIMTYDKQWREVIERIGRWVDMDDQYRTMDNEYIESVWWGLGKLWQKGLIYKDYRSSLYSPSIGVPLSHTDVAMEVKYQNETLTTPIVRFRVKPDSRKKLLSQVEEQISFNYSEQIRYKIDVEKRVELIEGKSKIKTTNLNEAMGQDKQKFESIDWENFKTSAEENKEIKHLKEQYEIILENIDTLGRLKKILTDNYDLSLLSWTTTPWSLPANVAIGVGSDIEYSLYYLASTSELVILAEDRAIAVLSLQLHEAVVNSPELQEELKSITDSSEYFRKLGVDIIKVVSFNGSDLEGLEYLPLFKNYQTVDSYEQRANLNKVYTSSFVTSDEGTGILHIAPAYGPEDFEIRQERNLPILLSLNDHGEIRDDLDEILKPVYGKKMYLANDVILDILDKKSSLFTTILFSHKVPYYDRDGKKVYYSAQEGWFIAETRLTSRSLELNKKIDWHPKTLRDGRFGNGLETAPDWSISRSRYWGTPIPIWVTEDQTKKIFISSLEQLSQKSANPIYKLINSNNLDPSLFEEGRAVIFSDSQTKLPLGINAVQYRSKSLMEMRREKDLDIKKFSKYAQKILDEIIELFSKYSTLQVLFNKQEQVFWTTWLYTLHPDSKKLTKTFYFYKKLKKSDTEKNFEPTGNIRLLDLHRPYIDDIILVDEADNHYYRITDVLDTWGDSGSMPWASWHYPFENKEFVESNMPADWITESQDQTRGWFRVLHVLSTGIFNKEAFEHINTTGMVLASDGRKMSKSKKNFTDPNILIDKFGADSIRNYIMSSPLLEADSLSFKDQDLQTVFRDTTLLLSNATKYIQSVQKENKHKKLPKNYKHSLNKWWLAYTKEYVNKIDEEMKNYRIQSASRLIIPYIRDFSTWYIRRSKDLLSTHSAEVAACLLETSRLFAIATASLQPFNTERLWSVVKSDTDPISVHLTDYPDKFDLNEDEVKLGKDMEDLRDTVSQIHSVRKERNIRVRQPLYADFSAFTGSKDYLEIIHKECNLLDKSLEMTEGEIFEPETKMGSIKVDLVLDENLQVLGYCRDFQRSVQTFRKKQGFEAGEVVSMKWQPVDVKQPDLFQEVVKKMDWDKLDIDIKWVKNLDTDLDKKFEVKGMATILVDD